MTSTPDRTADPQAAGRGGGTGTHAARSARDAAAGAKGAAEDAADTAHQAARSRPARIGARIGLGSRAVVYLTLTVLVLQVAFGGRQTETDQGGALRDLGRSAAGTVLLWLLVLGIVCYVLWRWSVAAFGTPAEHGTKDRWTALVEGVAYAPFAAMAASTAAGNPQRAEQGQHYRSLSATVMAWPGGRWLVGAVGVGVVVVGVYLASQGPRRSFLDTLDFGGVAPVWRRVITVLGVVGSTGRGAVFALSGVLVVVAAATADPSKAGGIDAALKTLAGQPYGQALLTLAAAGFAAFGLFALGEAVWREV